MIKNIRIQDIILIKSADIAFEKGLNVLSGETGSGKSAIMAALGLLTGSRTDASLVRSGAEKGIVEAIFDISGLPQVKPFLNEAGFEIEDSEELILKREISATGKSRAWLNQQTTQISFLQKLSKLLIQIVGQHANQSLFELEQHRVILDLFGSIDTSSFATVWDDENAIRNEMDALNKSEAQRIREIDICRMELQELQEASLQPGEEETLFDEYKRLTHAEELAQRVHTITQALAGEEHALLIALNTIQLQFDKIVQLDRNLNETSELVQTATIHLREAVNSLQYYLSCIECQPERAQQINDRLSLITKLKRKYGSDIVTILTYMNTTENRLQSLEQSDQRNEELQKNLKKLEEKSNNLAMELSTKRKEVAKHLEKQVGKQLVTLNMPKASFLVEISNQRRTRNGDDGIEFYLNPNIGEEKIAIRECASGGELSRVMLALQTLLAGKEQISSLVFDEIDANIGGETASAVGQKLKEIGKKHQVLCITHFPQVAKFADHHLQISKSEENGRTLTRVKTLDLTSREAELTRMSGDR